MSLLQLSGSHSVSAFRHISQADAVNHALRDMFPIKYHIRPNPKQRARYRAAGPNRPRSRWNSRRPRRPQSFHSFGRFNFLTIRGRRGRLLFLDWFLFPEEHARGNRTAVFGRKQPHAR
jgi:hypothetical protein